jgi:hypothetical protein
MIVVMAGIVIVSTPLIAAMGRGPANTPRSRFKQSVGMTCKSVVDTRLTADQSDAFSSAREI